MKKRLDNGDDLTTLADGERAKFVDETDATSGSLEQADSREGLAEDDDPWAGPSFELPPLEKLLLGIIRAHPTRKNTDRERLNRGMEALVLRRSSPIPLPGDGKDLERAQLDKALSWMIANRRKDEWRARGWDAVRRPGVGPFERSDSELARAAVELFWSSDNPSTLNRRSEILRNNFNGHYHSKKYGEKVTPAAYREFLRYKMENHTYVRESVEAQSLNRVKNEFNLWRVALVLDDDAVIHS